MIEDKSPPDALTDKGKEEWRRVLRLLDKKGFIEDLDRSAIQAYCEACAEFNEMSRLVQKSGPVMKTEKGNWVFHPLVACKNQAAERMMKFAKDLGLTPWARSKMDAMEKDAEDEFSAFLKKNKA